MMYLPHQRHSSIMRDGESLNQKKSWPLSSALRPFCSAKPAVVGRYLQAPTVIEFIIDREKNVLPIVPPGNALIDMVLESEGEVK